MVVAQPDDVAMFEASLFDWQFVDEDAVAAIEIGECYLVVGQSQQAVSARDGLVADAKLIVRLASDRDLALHQLEDDAFQRSCDCDESGIHVCATFRARRYH